MHFAMACHVWVQQGRFGEDVKGSFLEFYMPTQELAAEPGVCRPSGNGSVSRFLFRSVHSLILLAERQRNQG